FLPPFAAVRNPLDITGFILSDALAAASGAGDAALTVVAADPDVDFIFNALAIPTDEPPDTTLLHRRLSGVVAAQAGTDKPIVHFTTVCTDLSPFGRSVLAEYGLHALGGIEFGVRAVGHALRWSALRARPPEQAPARRLAPAPAGRDGWSEA